MFTILIVEDSNTEALELTRKLLRMGYHVLRAASGEEGVVLAAAEQPDAILMDVVMPGLNGFQATRQLKHSADTKHIPVIIHSSKGSQVDILWGKRQGAENYLIKPCSDTALTEAIDRALLRQSKATISQT